MHNPKHCTDPKPFRVHVTAAGALLAGMLALGGCERNTAPAAEQTPAAAPQAPVDNLLSNVPVQGNEALPPSHPPLPTAMPPHPTGAAGSRPDLDRQIAAEHPQGSGKNKPAVVVPDAVKAQWTGATLAVSAGGQEKQVKLAIGKAITVGDKLELHLLHYLPAYTSNFQTVTSSSSEPVNPAVQVKLVSNGQVLAEGWVFQNLPDFNSFKSEQVQVRLVSGERAATK